MQQMDNCSHQYGGEVQPQGTKGQFNRLIHWPFTFWFQLGTCQQRNIFHLAQSLGQRRCSVRQTVLPNYGARQHSEAKMTPLNSFKQPWKPRRHQIYEKKGRGRRSINKPSKFMTKRERGVDIPSKCRHIETNTWYLFTRDPDKQPDIAAKHNRGKQFKWIQMDSRGFDCGHIQGKSLRWMRDGK